MRGTLGSGAVLAALAAACNVLTGASELDIDRTIPQEGGLVGTGGEDASIESSVRTDSGGPDGNAGPDAAPPCTKCNDGKCCLAPKVCLATTGVCSACVVLNGTCKTQNDCCAPSSCNAGGKCAATCGAAGVGCTYQERSRCCAGLGCDLLANKCAVCKDDGVACSSPNGDDPTCCGHYCFNGKCVTD